MVNGFILADKQKDRALIDLPATIFFKIIHVEGNGDACSTTSFTQIHALLTIRPLGR
jgi:hypothetical protein